MARVTIDIVSDIACPWCAIGYARLAEAMAELDGEMDIAIEWHAFELNPDKAAGGEPIIQALSRKYGRSPQEMEAAQEDMIRIATELGLNFEKMQQRYTRNTFDGHRLVKWAAEHGHQTEMKLALFEAYFGRAENIADHQILLGCVTSVGLDVGEAQSILTSDRYAHLVREDEARWQSAGVTAVPAFILNGKYMISGAQEPQTLITALRKVATE